MPSVCDILAQRARDEPRTRSYDKRRTVHRRYSSSSSGIVENRPDRETRDEFGRLIAGEAARSSYSDFLGVPAAMSSSPKDTVRPSSASGMVGRPVRPQLPEVESRASGDADRAPPPAAGPPLIEDQAPTSYTLLTRRRHQRPISLVMMDNHRSLSSLDVNSNDGQLLRAEELRPATASPRQRAARLSVERGAVESLSKSCGDLQRAGEPETPPFARQFQPLCHHRGDPLRCPSHLSLCSVQVSSPTRTDSPAGSRGSLLSEGPDSYEGLCERAYKASFLLGSQELPSVGRGKEERERMVREWLSKQQSTDETTVNANGPPPL